MRRIGIDKVRSRFSQIVDRVLREGRSVTVTRHGKPVVDITPTRERPANGMTRAQAMEEIARLRQEVPRLTRQQVLDLVEEGRRRWPVL